MEKKKLVLGVIGADVHAVGNAILNRAFLDAGFDVTNLGVLVPQDEFIKAAVEVGAQTPSSFLLSMVRAKSTVPV